MFGSRSPDSRHHGGLHGRRVYSPALMDFILQVDKTAHMFITGPGVIKEVTGAQLSFEELGGQPFIPGIRGGSFGGQDDLHGLSLIRQLLSYLPQSNRRNPRNPKRG